MIESFGRNSRISFPYRRIEKLRNVPRDERRTGGMLTHVYHLFPNVMLSTFPTNRLMTVLEPLAVDRTRLVTYTLPNQIAAEDGRAAVAQGRDFAHRGRGRGSRDGLRRAARTRQRRANSALHLRPVRARDQALSPERAALIEHDASHADLHQHCVRGPKRAGTIRLSSTEPNRPSRS